MFNQQQFQQQLLQLQHLLQQQPPPPPQPAGRGVTPPQQQPMLNLRAANQASLLNANPMLQRALLMQQMQGNLRAFNMAAAPVLQQFFPQATRHSLLGPPPVGVSLKPARLPFPSLPFQRQNSAFRKDFPRVSERKREADSSVSSSSSSQAPGTDERGPLLEGCLVKAESEQPSSSPSETLRESSPDGEPASKRLKSGDDESVPDDALGIPKLGVSAAESHVEETDHRKENLTTDASKEENFSEEPKTPEVVSSAGSLKVTIQQSSESRAISTTSLKPAHWTSEMGTAETSPEAAVKFYCYICKTNCSNQQNFQAHMAGLEHQQRLQEIQHMSNICLVSLLPMMKEQRPLAEKDGESQQRWCNTCQLHFTGDLIKHRRTQEHKLAKRSLRPFCTVCSRHFKTPRKFVEHVKSLEHKQKAKEAKLGEKEQGGPEDSEELITVDAVGCFEDDEEEDEEEEDEVEGAEDFEVGQLDGDDPLAKQTGLKEVTLGDVEGDEKYSPDTIYGPDLLVPVAGFLCRLCRTFYHSDSAARLAHCKSLMHFENFQRYKAARLQATAVLSEATSGPQLRVAEDHQTTPAAGMERAEGSEEAVALRAASEEGCQAPEEEDRPSTPRDSLAAVPTDEIVGALLVEEDDDEGNDFATLSNHSLLGDAAAVTGDPVGLCVQEKEPSSEAIQEGSSDGAAADEGDPGAKEASASGDQLGGAEPSSPPKREASAGRRRSSRRRVR